MRDLTQGSIPAHIVRMAAPVAIGMVFQTAYYFIDLYFVGRLGDAAIAGVAAAGNLQFIVIALTQVLGVGTMVLISHAAGRKDRADANLVFNQSVLLAALAAALTLGLGFPLSGAYLRTVSADAETVRNGTAYLFGFLPALAMQFALVSMGSALRGSGIAKPMMVVQMLTVVLNAALAPVLIAGWGTGHPLGVVGAGLASTISVVVGVALLFTYFRRVEKSVAFNRTLLRPRLEVWGRLLRIGVPAGAEFFLMFLSMAVNYWIIRDFGAASQAGYGVGSRVLQAVLLPGMAVAFAAAPIAGQNFAAGHPERARRTFVESVKLSSAIMLLLTIVCRWRPEWLVHWFSPDAVVVSTGAEFLRIISLNFVAAGIVFTCSGMFQAMGNTVPTVISSAVRLVSFVVPALWFARQPGFALWHLWYVSVAAATAHCVFTVWLLRREAAKRLAFGVAPAAVSVPVEAGA
ncbi:MAG: MATE family efflux transporter [Gemmatimonadetes bacterium]|jgi:putative MATE family efflux protein|nr:MATE family efflux transporter [Gemmatimonadota bacterium]